jgi:hypothetical protein
MIKSYNIQLESHPELAFAAPNADGNIMLYTPLQLRHLVQYAEAKNISIMPEIMYRATEEPVVWGRLWSALYLFVNTGYGIPLNVSHPDFIPLLRDVLKEVY